MSRPTAERLAKIRAFTDSTVMRPPNMPLVVIAELFAEIDALAAEHGQAIQLLDHRGVEIEGLRAENARLAAAVKTLREALADMYDLAFMLDDDDSWYGERRKAPERLAKAKRVLAETAAAGEGGA